MKYHGSCHCGQITFDFETDEPITQAMSCNCSICQRKGAVMWFGPKEQFHLQNPQAKLSTYTFNKHVVQHHFCPVCGMHPYGEAVSPKGHHMVAVNLRCVDGIDLNALSIQHYDGRSL